MRIWTKLAMSGLISLGVMSTSVAQDRGTRDEAKGLTDQAINHIKKVGPEKAYKDFTTDKATWTKKDLYIMVFDSKGYSLAHGANEKLVGKDMIGLKDANGVLITKGLIAVAEKGGGWFDYDWPDPVSKKVMAKSTYVAPLPAGGGLLGVGVYK